MVIVIGAESDTVAQCMRQSAKKLRIFRRVGSQCFAEESRVVDELQSSGETFRRRGTATQRRQSGWYQLARVARPGVVAVARIWGGGGGIVQDV